MSPTFAKVAAVVVAAMSASAAQAIEVSQAVTLSGDPAALWERIGAFCAIGDWHPAIATCEEREEGGQTFRTLSLEGGGTIEERLVERSDTGYTYEIVESPLPVQNYRSSFGLTPGEGGTTLAWSGTFDAKGATDADAEGVIAGIYQAGLEGIAAQ